MLTYKASCQGTTSHDFYVHPEGVYCIEHDHSYKVSATDLYPLRGKRTCPILFYGTLGPYSDNMQQQIDLYTVCLHRQSHRIT